LKKARRFATVPLVPSDLYANGPMTLSSFPIVASTVAKTMELVPWFLVLTSVSVRILGLAFIVSCLLIVILLLVTTEALVFSMERMLFASVKAIFLDLRVIC